MKRLPTDARAKALACSRFRTLRGEACGGFVAGQQRQREMHLSDDA